MRIILGKVSMPKYQVYLYDTSGRRITRSSLRISAIDDLEAVTRTAEHGPLDVYRAILRDGNRIVAEWRGRKISFNDGGWSEERGLISMT